MSQIMATSELNQRLENWYMLLYRKEPTFRSNKKRQQLAQNQENVELTVVSVS